MITSPVGTVLKHKSGAVAILSEADPIKPRGILCGENNKSVHEYNLSNEGWVAVSTLHELSKEQIDMYQKCLLHIEQYHQHLKPAVKKLKHFYEIPVVPYSRADILEELEAAKILMSLIKPSEQKQKEASQVSNRSDGSTASYYQLPEGAKELQDLISHRNMNAQLGEIFRACYRFGMASHSDQLRDAKKIKFYIEAEIKRLEANG